MPRSKQLDRDAIKTYRIFEGVALLDADICVDSLYVNRCKYYVFGVTRTGLSFAIAPREYQDRLNNDHNRSR